MDGGGHLVPLSYVYGYRGGVGRRGVAQDTIGDNGIEIRARVRRYQLILWRCAAGFVPKSAISEISRSGQRKNGSRAFGRRGGGWGYQHHSAPDSGAESEFSGHNLKASRAKQQVFSGVDTDTPASES